MKNKASKKLLIIDDDRIFCRSLEEYLAGTDILVHKTHSAKEGIEFCRSAHVDIVLLDENLPDGQGHLLCPDIIRTNEEIKIIFITAFPSFIHAIQAIKAGAYDYLSKPFDIEELQLAITQAARTLDLEKASNIVTYRNAKEKKQYVPVGDYADGGKVSELIRLAAGTNSSVLLTGETGTGKGVVARVVHFNGTRSEAPFIPVNCAAIPENLIEAELFGCEKGAFTGAVSSRKGLFELADGGTLFLDEIGAMPLHLQSKLLGVLEDGQVKRLGGQVFIPINVRIISATNADLEEMIVRKTFRQDLFYRLSVLQIHLPPLRKRTGDIPAICSHILAHSHGGHGAELPDSELRALSCYSWPGNIRELSNILERSLLLHRTVLRPSELIQPKSKDGNFSTEILGQNEKSPESETILTLEELNRLHIQKALSFFNGNWTRTAKALGVSISTLKRKALQLQSD